MRPEVDAQAFQDGACLTKLDVQFAALHFNALHAKHSGGELTRRAGLLAHAVRGAQYCPNSIALAGMNAHINHDPPMAFVTACQTANVVSRDETPQYADYTNANSTLDGIKEPAKQQLNIFRQAPLADERDPRLRIAGVD